MPPSPKHRAGPMLGAAVGSVALAVAIGAVLPSRAESTAKTLPRATAVPGTPIVKPGAHSASRGAAPASSGAVSGVVPSAGVSTTVPSAHLTSPDRIVIAAGGDVNFGRECGQAILADIRYDPFRFLGPLWGDADLRFVNLESQLSDQKGETQSPRNRLIFTGPPGGADTLAQAGIHVVSTANNHAWDYGRSAFFETLDNLARTGVKNAGSGRTLAEAYAPAVHEVRGKRIAIFAVTHIWNAGNIEEHQGRHYVAWARQNRVRRELERARGKYDIVLLSYHGGVEYIDAPVGPTRRFLEGLVKKGLVDAVLGHHPHVPQGIGWYGGRPIFYSLGNFVFAGHDWAPWTKVGFVARLEIEPERPLIARICPVALDGHVPRPILPSDPASARARAHVLDTSTTVGGTDVGEIDARGCFEVMPRKKPPEPGAPDSSLRAQAK